MSAWKIETLDEVLEVCQRITAQIGGCTCPDEPHQNALHDLAVDLPEWLAGHDAEVARKAKVEALREVAAKWTDEIYPVDIFVPLTAEDHAEINRVLKEHFGRSSARDAISGDMMRRAANLLRLHADEIETEAPADASMDVYDRQMENTFNSLDDDGVLDDLANDHAGFGDTVQGRGEQP